MPVPLLTTVTAWACPNCPVTEITHGPVPNRFHTCAGLHMLTAPLVPAGTRCKVEAMVREDYAGREQGLRYDQDRRPIMSVVTTRDDGQDTAVFAPAATAREDR